MRTEVLGVSSQYLAKLRHGPSIVTQIRHGVGQIEPSVDILGGENKGLLMGVQGLRVKPLSTVRRPKIV